MQLDYTPPKSLLPFLLSDKFASFVIGPYGSGKTTAGILKIAYEAAKVAKSRDGVRRSRVAIVRNTMPMLRDSTIPDFLKWFPDGVAGIYRKTERVFELQLGSGGDKVVCEVLFRGLDDANDVRQLLSTQLTFGVMDEFREIHPQVYEALAGRVGRYPDKILVPPRPEWGVDEKGNPIGGCVDDNGKPVKKIWGMSNPPDLDSWWEQLLSDPPDNMHVSIQPSGLSPEADWLQYLDSNYYENLAELHANDQDWIDVYIHGKFGKSLSGQPVFRCFDQSLHVAKEELKPLYNTPLIIGIDAGLNPTAVITQQTYDGRVLVLDAITANDGGMGALRFIKEKLKPLLANKYSKHLSTNPAPNPNTFSSLTFPSNLLLIIDPAAFQRAQTDERSVADVFKTEGFTVKPAKTNTIAARIAAVESYLTRIIDGKPAILFCPEGARGLVKALRSGYRYRINTKGERDDKPEKRHPDSDFADALQYACLYHDGGATFGGSWQENRKVELKPAPYRWVMA